MQTSTELTEVEEAALQERDERVLVTIVAQLDVLDDELRNVREQIEDLNQRATDIRRGKQAIRNAARCGEWWKLRGILSEQDIESLCSISPINILED